MAPAHVFSRLFVSRTTQPSLVDASHEDPNGGSISAKTGSSYVSGISSTLRMPGAYPHGSLRRREARWMARRREETSLKNTLASNQQRLHDLRRQNQVAQMQIQLLREERERLRTEEMRLRADNELAEWRRRQQENVCEELRRQEDQLREERQRRTERLRQEQERQREEERAERQARWQREDDPAALLRSYESYESKWTALRASINLGRLLYAEELPWPVHDIQTLANVKVAPDEALAAVKAFILCEERPGYENKDSRQRIHAELLRWHPDKFQSRIVPLVWDHQREDTLRLAEQITVFLNSIASEAPEPKNQ